MRGYHARERFAQSHARRDGQGWAMATSRGGGRAGVGRDAIDMVHAGDRRNGTWKLDTANSSPASTVTKVGVADADSPNVQSIEIRTRLGGGSWGDVRARRGGGTQTRDSRSRRIQRAERTGTGEETRARTRRHRHLRFRRRDGPTSRRPAATKRQKPSSALFRNLPHGRPSWRRNRRDL